jgi:hypothetical protein
MRTRTNVVIQNSDLILSRVSISVIRGDQAMYLLTSRPLAGSCCQNDQSDTADGIPSFEVRSAPCYSWKSVDELPEISFADQQTCLESHTPMQIDHRSCTSRFTTYSPCTTTTAEKGLTSMPCLLHVTRIRDIIMMQRPRIDRNDAHSTQRTC